MNTAFIPPRGNTAAAPAPAPEARAPQAMVSIWPIVLVIYATLLPREIRFQAWGLYFFADRIALMIILPFMLYKISQRAIKFVLPDWLVLFSGAWMIVSMCQIYGVDRGFASGGAVAFDSTAGYFLARISFRSLTDMRRGLILVAPGFFAAGMSLLIESVTHVLFVRPFFISIFGPLTYTGGGTDVVLDTLRDDSRLGLQRAYGPWPHPILAGLHLATLFPVYWMSGVRGWPRTLGILAAMMSIFTVSSASFNALGLGIFLVGYDWLSRHSRDFTWQRFLLAVGAFVFIAQFAMGGGVVGLVIRFAALDQSTAYFRLLIWEFGSASVMAHPLFGIGFEGYVRPVWMITQSVDNHWLLWAMRYGLPAAVATFGASVVALIALGRSASQAPPTDARFYRGIAIGLALLMLMMWTVTLQGGTLTWFTLLLGGCVACAQRSFGRRTFVEEVKAPPPRRALPAPAR